MAQQDRLLARVGCRPGERAAPPQESVAVRQVKIKEYGAHSQQPQVFVSLHLFVSTRALSFGTHTARRSMAVCELSAAATVLSVVFLATQAGVVCDVADLYSSSRTALVRCFAQAVCLQTRVCLPWVKTMRMEGRGTLLSQKKRAGVMRMYVQYW